MTSLGRETQVRKLEYVQRFGLAQKLDKDSAWKDVMSLIRRTPTDSIPCTIKYTTRHIDMVEDAGVQQQRSCAEIFLEEWGCSGPRLPTLGDLLTLLVTAQKFHAADYVAGDLLKEPHPIRPEFGPAARVPDPFDMHPQPLPSPSAPSNSQSVPAGDEVGLQIQQIPANTSPHCSSNQEIVDAVAEESSNSTIAQHQETELIQNIHNNLPRHIPYKILQDITKNFDSNPVGENNGRLLGKGEFGSVHLAVQDSTEILGNQFAAVKRLNRDAGSLFENERETLLRLKHPNLLCMIGYSNDEPECCLVFEYMSQGNLEERLSCKGRWGIPLSHLLRIKTAFGASVGLRHMHEHYVPPLIHRDVKSANILLDKDLNPKLGDFGLVRSGQSASDSASVQLTQKIIGTSAYMSPEAMDGEVSVKMDVFSIGVVLLEILTGLSPYDADGNESDLITFVSDNCTDSIECLLDMRVGNWNRDQSSQLFLLAQSCLKEKSERPFIATVVEKLQSILRLQV